MKIIVNTDIEKQEILNASETIHFLECVDTDIPGVNTICHLYLHPELIEIDPDLVTVLRNEESEE
jgi:hypothetical protein